MFSNALRISWIDLRGHLVKNKLAFPTDLDRDADPLDLLAAFTLVPAPRSIQGPNGVMQTARPEIPFSGDGCQPRATVGHPNIGEIERTVPTTTILQRSSRPLH